MFTKNLTLDEFIEEVKKLPGKIKRATVEESFRALQDSLDEFVASRQCPYLLRDFLEVDFLNDQNDEFGLVLKKERPQALLKIYDKGSIQNFSFTTKDFRPPQNQHGFTWEEKRGTYTITVSPQRPLNFVNKLITLADQKLIEARKDLNQTSGFTRGKEEFL